MPVLYDSPLIPQPGLVASPPAKSNPTQLSRAEIEEIAQQRTVHVEARVRQAAEVANAAKSVQQARSRLLQAPEDGKRLGIGTSELGRLSGVERHTVYRWLRTNRTPYEKET